MCSSDLVTYRQGKTPIVVSLEKNQDKVEESFEIPVSKKVEESYDDSHVRVHDVNVNKLVELEDHIEVREEKKEGFFTKAWNKLKRSKLGVKLTAVGLAALAGFGLYSCSQRLSKQGYMFNSNLRGTTVDIQNDPNLIYVNQKSLQQTPVQTGEWFYQTSTPTRSVIIEDTAEVEEAIVVPVTLTDRKSVV